MGSERRLHPLSFLFAMQDSAKQFLLPLLVGLFAARGADRWELWTAFALVPMAGAALGRSLSVRYRFDDDELVIRSGFLFKRVRHIPYDRIQNVDAVHNPLHRLLRVIEVRVETGGGADTEAVLRVVKSSALEEIRSFVFAKRGGLASAVDSATGGDQKILLAMSPGEVALFGFIQGYGMIVAGALLGLLSEIGILDRVVERLFGERGEGRGVLRQLASSALEGGSWPVRQVLFTVATLIALLVLFRLLSAAWMSLTYWGFRLTRAGDDLRCEYGLFTRVVSTVPVRRIQKLTLREGPWHRIADRVSLQVQTAGGKAGEDGQSTRTWLAPLIQKTSVPELIATILPEVATPVEWQPVHPRGVRREFVGNMVVVLPLFALLTSAVGWWALVPLPVMLGWSLFYAQRTVAGLRWAVSNDAVHFGNGWIWRSVLSAPLTKVQVVARGEGPFDRRHGMASVSADTAGRQMTGYSITIPYLAAPVAAALSARLSAAASRTPFRW